MLYIYNFLFAFLVVLESLIQCLISAREYWSPSVRQGLEEQSWVTGGMPFKGTLDAWLIPVRSLAVAGTPPCCCTLPVSKC